MTKRFYLHIGAPKTGTTYLQQVLHRNRRQLKAAGVLYPRNPGDAHHSALWDLRGAGEKRDYGRDIRGDWDRCVRLVSKWDGPTAVMSSELFVYADRAECKRALTAFGNIEVHVIYTARDLVRQAPAVWQERLKNQHTLGYDAFLDDVLGPRKSAMSKGFWSAQDAPTALQKWSQGLPPEHVHVVTTPPSGAAPSLLWERFASVIGVDPTAFDIDVPVVNTSMSVTAAEVLRRYNIRHGKSMAHIDYRRHVKTDLFQILTEVVNDDSKLTLTAAQEGAFIEQGKVIADDDPRQRV